MKKSLKLTIGIILAILIKQLTEYFLDQVGISHQLPDFVMVAVYLYCKEFLEDS